MKVGGWRWRFPGCGNLEGGVFENSEVQGLDQGEGVGK